MTTNDQHPGVFLLERYLRPLNITPSDLAQSLGIEERQVYDLIEGRSPIAPDMAARLALFFDVPTRWWLELQARYDAEHVAPLEELRGEVTPYPGLEDILVTPGGIEQLVPTTEPSPKTMVATYSEDLLNRLKEQAKWAKEVHRTPVQITLPDGTAVLTGK
jgi:addiction module HigA family antidote